VRARYRAEGPDGLLDRSCVPQLVANCVQERRVGVIAALRRLRMIGAGIAVLLAMALLTVSGGMKRSVPDWGGGVTFAPMCPLFDRDPVSFSRFAGALRDRVNDPGELIHIDVEKFGRVHDGAGHRVAAQRGRYSAR
jgi:hypothetical protein